MRDSLICYLREFGLCHNNTINWHAFFDAVKHLNHMSRMSMEVAQPSLILRGFDYLRTRGYVG